MKTFALITFVLLLLHYEVSGQGSALILVKTKNGFERAYKEGKMVKAVLMNGEVFKGIMAVVNDSCITLGTDTIRLSQVERFRIKSSSNFISGTLIIGAGVLGTVIGVNLIAGGAAAGEYAAFFGMLFGLPMATVGVMTAGAGLAVILAGKKYTRHKWQFSVNQVAQPVP